MEQRKAIEVFHQKYGKFPEDMGYFHIDFYDNMIIYAPSDKEAIAFVTMQKLFKMMYLAAIPVGLITLVCGILFFMIFPCLWAVICTCILLGSLVILYKCIDQYAKSLIKQYSGIHVEIKL